MDAVTPHTGSILPTRVSIDRQRWVSIRPIERSDASALSDFYSRLSVESRRTRFLSCGSAPGPVMTARLADAHGYVGILREAGALDGAIVAHTSLQPDGLGSAEVAFAVADELHGHGIGRRLVALVLEDARARGLHRVTATLLAENTAMRHLLREAGSPVLDDRIDAGVEEVVLGLDDEAVPLHQQADEADTARAAADPAAAL